MDNYEISVDVWAGNPVINWKVLADNGVAGAIIRLNSISGHLKKDVLFDTLWVGADILSAKCPYLVVAPWETAGDNYDFFMKTLPANYNGTVCLDVEAGKGQGYSPVMYSDLVSQIAYGLSKHHNVKIYTGGGYIELLNKWPLEYKYWWAGYTYPTIYKGITSWDNLHAIIKQMPWNPTPNKNLMIPGAVIEKWQVTDQLKDLPGFNGHPIDINVSPFTMNQEVAWYGEQFFSPIDIDGGNTMTDSFSGFATGAMFTEKTLDVDATKLQAAGFNFVVDVLGEGVNLIDGATNHMAEAYRAGIPCIGFYTMVAEVYGADGYAPEHMPALQFDKPYQALKKVVQSGNVNRYIQGIIIDIGRLQQTDGKDITEGWINYFGAWTRDLVSSFGIKPFIMAKQDALTKFQEPGNTFSILMGDKLDGAKRPIIGSNIAVYQNTQNNKVSKGAGCLDYPANDFHTGAQYGGWKFVWFGTGHASCVKDASGMPQALAEFVYCGTPASMYSYLGFTPSEVVNPDPGGTTTPPTPGVAGQLTDAELVTVRQMISHWK